MTLREFAKVADFESEYSALSVYDPTGMIDCGYFNGFYKLDMNDSLLDYEVLSIKGNYSVRINITEAEAREQEEKHKAERDFQLYGKR